MNKAMRHGKSSELVVAGELIRHGLDVYIPSVDDQAIDLVVRLERPEGVHYYDLQIKSVAGYNRIIGVKSPRQRSGNYVLVIHYRHTGRPDEFFYLTADQVEHHLLKDSAWGDLVFNKPERAAYAKQDLADLARALLAGEIRPVPRSLDVLHIAHRHVVWKLGDAIRVRQPRWNLGEWEVELLDPEGQRVIGQLYYDRLGKLIEEKSSTHESLMESYHAAGSTLPAA